MLKNNLRILVLNSGSSSIKFTILCPQQHTIFLQGMVSAIDTAKCILSYSMQKEHYEQNLSNCDFKQALQTIFSLLQSKPALINSISGIGHRVVHGGEYFLKSCIIDDKVLEKIIACNPLAPAHNPVNVEGIQQAKILFPHLTQVASFDTAFHQTMPKRAYLYALPYTLYEKYKIRRYGFHGISHQYVTLKAAELLNKPIEQTHFISLHLGHGCSITAVKGGKSIDTSMGLTPLEGLVMGNRCGDIDPSIVILLMQQHGFSLTELTTLLNDESGLFGISGISDDMRTIIIAAQAGHQRAKLAIDIFCYRLAKYVAAFSVSLQKVDALIFTGGVGEHSCHIRAHTLKWLECLGYFIDQDRNLTHGELLMGLITQQNSQMALVIPTDEAAMIANDTYDLLCKS